MVVFTTHTNRVGDHAVLTAICTATPRQMLTLKSTGYLPPSHPQIALQEHIQHIIPILDYRPQTVQRVLWVNCLLASPICPFQRRLL